MALARTIFTGLTDALLGGMDRQENHGKQQQILRQASGRNYATERKKTDA